MATLIVIGLCHSRAGTTSSPVKPSHRAWQTGLCGYMVSPGPQSSLGQHPPCLMPSLQSVWGRYPASQSLEIVLTMRLLIPIPQNYSRHFCGGIVPTSSSSGSFPKPQAQLRAGEPPSAKARGSGHQEAAYMRVSLAVGWTRRQDLCLPLVERASL
uniref:Uncharacterized protein n=1 Tax=Molossus molossus TaxID=27622 RepID=A0A7J8CYY3_MOLMO|nr:hypothetical protein HJG59_009441 [Molossus molossus]